MRFLRVLRLGLILPRLVRHIARVIAVRDGETRGGDGAGIHLHAIGPHVRDRAVFVEALRDPHRVAGREAELARRLLLQRRGGEGRRRIARRGLRLDGLDREAAFLDRLLRRHRIAFGTDRQPVELLAVPLDEPRGERGAVLLHRRDHRPIFLGAERLDLALALDDQAQRDRLDAPGGLGARQLAPQHRRQREADEIVERPARPVRVDQVGIQLARVLHRLGHRRLGDGVEGDALDLLGQRLAQPQDLLHVPADRLAFAVRIGREDQAVGGLRQIGDRLQLLGLVGVVFPVHREAVVRLHRSVLGGQVADMAVGGEHAVVAAQVFLDGLRLGRRFDDD